MNAAGQPVAPGTGLTDLRGASRMAVDAVKGITDLVEDMHRNIAAGSSVVGKAPQGRTGGVTGLVYGSVRGVTHAVGFGIDLALASLAPLLGRAVSSPRREAILAALNGVLGDYLAATVNPLAIEMCLRRAGQTLDLTQPALALAMPKARQRLLVLVHGLCMNDLQWNRAGHDHGAALAEVLDATAVYLHYNSGMHISLNGRAFAGVLDELVRAWPVPVTELTIVGHSMGGLVTRSAVAQASAAGLAWPALLGSMVFLGTPHHGAPLERAGNRANFYIGISPYTAPFTRLGGVRSAGIRDLRHGNLQDCDWQGLSADSARDARVPVTLPKGVKCFAIAATKRAQAQSLTARLPGDGLVPVASALGQHADPRFALRFPASRTHIAFGADHFDLLSSAEVGAVLRAWLRPARPVRPARQADIVRK